MSLQVWLPLDGDLKNQGLTDVEVTNHSATIDNNGKIGKCYNFNGSSYIDTGYKESIGTGDFSISAWIYITQTSGKTYQCIIGNKSTGAVSVGFAIYWNQNQKKFLWSTADGSAATEIWSTDTFDTIIYNSWHHIVMCRNNNDSRKGYFYLDGVRKEIASIPAIRNITSTTSIKIGSVTPSAAAYYFTGKINDVRIYDHCLSIKEVKELAKGLVLHYKLNKPMPNLLSKYVSPGQANPGVTTTAGRTNYLGNYSIQIPAAENADTYFRLFLTKQLIQNNKYTFSCYVSGLKEGTYYNFPFFAQGNTGMGVIHLDHNGLNTVTFTMNSSAQNAITDPEGKTVYIMFMDDSGRSIASGQQPFQITQMKLEKGDKVTEWIPNESDPLYSALGYDSNIESDCSGYKRDGIITGTIIGNTDTPRYRTSSNITNNSSYIKTDNLITTGFENSYSFSWWAKVPNYNNMHWGFANGIRLNGMYTGKLWNTGDSSNNPIYQPGTTTQITVPSANIWHHFVMTGDGISCKLYVDGKHYGTAKTYKKISGTTLIINGWDTGTSYSGQMYISDFRIYCTALSADDIKALYEDSASIDKNGNFHAYEYIEDDNIINVNINKQGIFTVPEEIMENSLKEPSIDDENIYAKGEFYED